MRHLAVPADSVLFAEGSALASRSSVAMLDPGDLAGALARLDHGDYVLLDVEAAPRWLVPLTEHCRAGRLGAVRLVAGRSVASWTPIGFRIRPWVESIHLVGDGVRIPESIAPAPIHRSESLAASLDGFDRPAFLPAEIPTAFPPKIQIETTAYCTIDCPHCPVATRHIRDRTRMELPLFERLIDECRVHRPDSLELYLNGDPLTDDRLERLADLAKAATPTTLVEIITHERMINEHRAPRLAASGLDIVFVSVNFHEETDEAEVRERLERVQRIRAHFIAQGKELVMVTLANLLHASARPHYERIASELGLPWERFRATGRLGDVDLALFPQTAGARARASRVCERPFTKAYVRATGAVLLCCEDWQDRWVLGNVQDQPLAEIWTNTLYRERRRALLSGGLSAPCAGCEYAGPADVARREHALPVLGSGRA